MRRLNQNGLACYQMIENKKQEVYYTTGELTAFEELKTQLQKETDESLNAARRILNYYLARDESEIHTNGAGIPIGFSCIVCIATIAISLNPIRFSSGSEQTILTWIMTSLIFFAFIAMYWILSIRAHKNTKRLVYYRHCIQLIDEILASRSQHIRLTVSGLKILGVLRPPRA